MPKQEQPVQIAALTAEAADQGVESPKETGIEGKETQRAETEAALNAAKTEHADLMVKMLSLIQVVRETVHIPEDLRAQINSQIDQLGKDATAAGQKIIDLENRTRTLDAETAQAA